MPATDTAVLERPPVAAPLSSRTKIRIEGVSKSYDGKLALQRVDLQLPENSFTCLLGPSGCGKSTLLNMIAGFVPPTTGQVLVDGQAVAGADADRGVVFQEYALFPWRTALANIEFGPLMKRMQPVRRQETARKYLELVGLGAHGAKYPKELSGGMKQRVAIARALANNPSVLLMDEPFGALDAQTRETLQEELLRICEHERKTVVFVTHSISEAIFLADRIVVMATLPGAIKEVIDVPLAHPRDRSGPDFVAMERSIKTLVREEVQKLGVI
jgi:NitT/TauT family transport system ATP-binding protein